MGCSFVKRCLKRIVFDYYQPLKKKHYKSLKEKASGPIRAIKGMMYPPYNSEDFKSCLKKAGIRAGDSIFAMCSADKIYSKTGRRLPVHLVLNDLLEYIGEEGNLLVLGFSDDRKKITEGEQLFDVKKTPTMCGMLSELVRRKPGTVRSMQPVFSALVYGKKAKMYCDTHQLSPYPFDENSPYYKITKDGGKYLGIGIGVKGFTAGHMIDDYYKQNFRHKMYLDKPIEFNSIGHDGERLILKSFVRGRPSIFLAPRYYLKLLKVSYSTSTTKSGVSLFSMKMNDHFQAGIDLYDRKKTTIYDTGIPSWIIKIVLFYRKAKSLL